MVTNRPPQPSAMIWETTGGANTTSYAVPGALVTVGRTNYGDQFAVDLATGGATVLIYLDPIIDNAYGRYHDKLIRESEYGPAVPRWPGEPQANEYGYLNDFRVGGILQSKLEGVLGLMVSENPHMGGWLIDDVGSRSWFPLIDWDSWSATDQQAYRDGAIAICETVRRVADRHGLVFLVNGTWGAGALATNGGGYPDPDIHGCSLADGGVIENHPTGEIPYWTSYSSGANWADASPITQGVAFNWVWNINDPATRDAYVDADICSHALAQVDRYTAEAPWATFYDAGLPSGVSTGSVTRRNLSINPAAANDLTEWYETGPVAATTRVTGLAGMDRTTGASITGTGAASEYLIPAPGDATPGNQYTVSAQFRRDGTGGTVHAYILWLDAAQAVLGSATNSVIPAIGVPTRIYVSGTAPTGTVSVAFEAEIRTTTDTLTVTACLIEQSPTEGAYFDGDSPGGSWTGVAGNSTSTQASGTIVISPTAIPSAESVPAPTVALGITIRPTSIPSGERVPRPTVSGGAPPIDLDPPPTRWQLVAGPASGGHDLALTFARDRKLTIRLTEPSEASFAIDGRHHQAAALAELATDVHVLYTPPDGPTRVLYRGRVGTTRDALDADAHAVTVTTLDYRAVLARRILWSDSQLVWTATDQAAIARGLLAQTQGRPGGNLGISPGTGTTSITRDRTYEAGDSVAEKIQELAETVDGFDWSIEPTSASGLALRIHHPQRGTDRGVVLEYGGLVSTVDRNVDPGAYADAIRMTGRQNDAGTAPTPAELAAPDIAMVAQGRWDKTYGEDIETQAALDARATWQLGQAQIIRPSYTLGLRPGGWQGPDHIWVGDTVRVVVHSGRLAVDTRLRVHELGVDIPDTGDEQVALTVGAPKPDIRRRDAAVLRRLATLERR